MRRPAGVLLALLVPLILILLAPSAEAADGTYVQSLDVQIDVHEDGGITVTETETHVFPDIGNHHGILRSIQVAAEHMDSPTRQRVYPMSDLSVSSPSGAPVQVHRERDGEYEQLRIGDRDRSVSGEQVYEITYTLESIVNDGRVFDEVGEEHAELVYNVIGSANEQRYESIDVAVTGPGAAQQARCTAGAHGSDTECDSARPGATSSFSHSRLTEGEGLTVSLQYPRSAFGTDLEPQVERRANSILGPAMLGAAVLLPVVGGVAAAGTWWRKGRDEVYVGLTPGLLPPAGADAPTEIGSHGPVAVQFTPPEDVPAGLLGVIMDHRADTDDVTATILDLAVKGHLTIAEVAGKHGDWMLTWTGAMGAPELLAYEKSFLAELFRGRPQVQLSSVKDTFATTLKRVKKSMVMEGHDRGWFRRHPATAGGWMGPMSIVLVLGGLGMAFMGGEVPGTEPWLEVIPVGSNLLLGVAMVLTGLLLVGFSTHMAARSARGSALKAQAEGFKMYLETAEAGQIRFEEAAGLFSRYLPYAVIFGCAERWATVFDEVAESARAAGRQVDLPMWYVGASMHRASFRSLAADIDSFAVASNRTMTSTPSSSGKSSFRGGGIGGRVGGGGAGSVGGSW